MMRLAECTKTFQCARYFVMGSAFFVLHSCSAIIVHRACRKVLRYRARAAEEQRRQARLIEPEALCRPWRPSIRNLACLVPQSEQQGFVRSAGIVARRTTMNGAGIPFGPEGVDRPHAID